MRKPPARAVHGAHRGSRASAQRGMFANKVTFMQSVFSPSRPPLSVRYANAKSSKPAPPDFKKQEVVRSRNIAALGADVLEHVVAACWQSCERAPFCASVSKEFQHASVQAAKTLAAVDVVPHRPVMKVAGAPSLTPALSAEEDAAIEAWGEGMNAYKPRKGRVAPWTSSTEHH